MIALVIQWLQSTRDANVSGLGITHLDSSAASNERHAEHRRPGAGASVCGLDGGGTPFWYDGEEWQPVSRQGFKPGDGCIFAAFDELAGCESVEVTADTAGTTFTCSATSGGGTASHSVTIRRDATPPTVS